MIEQFLPGHDARLHSTVDYGQQETVPIEFHFSTEMSCSTIGSGLEIKSKTQDGKKPKLDKASIVCEPFKVDESSLFIGGVPTSWSFKANLTNVSNGIHEVVLKNIPTKDGFKLYRFH
jgi:alpha-1,3-glucan synthase